MAKKKVTVETPKQGDLRVWWIPQLGASVPTFYWLVKDIHTAKTLLDCLAQYDLFQLENRIKPDFCNAGGLEVYDTNSDGEGTPDWVEWMDESSGDDIDQYFENLEEQEDD
jgi:hypothetical protein